ncbi:hypothetical protein HaLaN_32577, partial [Haematococcus lacustris]
MGAFTAMMAGLPMCDYLVSGEDDQAAVERGKELMGLVPPAHTADPDGSAGCVEELETPGSVVAPARKLGPWDPQAVSGPACATNSGGQPVPASGVAVV